MGASPGVFTLQGIVQVQVDANSFSDALGNFNPEPSEVVTFIYDSIRPVVLHFGVNRTLTPYLDKIQLQETRFTVIFDEVRIIMTVGYCTCVLAHACVSALSLCLCGWWWWWGGGGYWVGCWLSLPLSCLCGPSSDSPVPCGVVWWRGVLALCLPCSDRACPLVPPTDLLGVGLLRLKTRPLTVNFAGHARPPQQPFWGFGPSQVEVVNGYATNVNFAPSRREFTFFVVATTDDFVAVTIPEVRSLARMQGQVVVLARDAARGGRRTRERNACGVRVFHRVCLGRGGGVGWGGGGSVFSPPRVTAVIPVLISMPQPHVALWQLWLCVSLWHQCGRVF